MYLSDGSSIAASSHPCLNPVSYGEAACAYIREEVIGGNTANAQMIKDKAMGALCLVSAMVYNIIVISEQL
jgi:hypothetical protein